MSVFAKPLMDLIHVWHEWTYDSSMFQKGKAGFQTSCPVRRQVLFQYDLSFSDCLDRNTNSLNASRCNETFCDQERFKLHETDKQVIHDNIKDITMIDILNNEFLSKFHFSLVEHQRVCDCLYKEHFDDGATCLIEIMEKCSKMVAYCFCDTLKLLEDKCCIVEGLVQDLQLREKYCLTEVNQNGKY